MLQVQSQDAPGVAPRRAIKDCGHIWEKNWGQYKYQI
jgi:hypothetical protein